MTKRNSLTNGVSSQIDEACSRIAPTWPLDQFIAVNPYWGWRELSIQQAAATLGTLSGTKLTMPRSWLRSEWEAGRLNVSGLDAASQSALDQPDIVIERFALATDAGDFEDLVIHQISQHCASYFDRYQATWHLDREIGLFGSWKQQLAIDRGVNWKHGRSWVDAKLDTLPVVAGDAIEQMVRALGIPAAGEVSYLTALLLSTNGWAAWCAYERWQARLVGGDDDEIVDLLAIRLAWEWLLYLDTTADTDVAIATGADSKTANDIALADWAHADQLAVDLAAAQEVDWRLQEAVERSYQQGIIDGLTQSQDQLETPNIQAVFCIDVRSEVFRRALEAASPDIHTRGFAGFFGLPISYSPLGSSLTRPQLPGLLSPALSVSETAESESETARLSDQRVRALSKRQRWSKFRTTPASVFSFVESMGLLYGPKLVADSLASTRPTPRWEDEGLSELPPPIRLPLVREDPAAAALIAQRVLRGMGLVEGFAALVLLCGHGSQSANNPHAAGLDCGACGGQTGEVNARVLADLLNSSDVRLHLRALGIDIPSSTLFLAGLHNTTTDEVKLFDSEGCPSPNEQEMNQLRKWLAVAADTARAERTGNIGLKEGSQNRAVLKENILKRANDWSQVRPEWGLAGNAAFVVAPRSRTRHLNLGGRVFLHDYDSASDADLSVLTLIMTAPMVVTNWINMQYFASTVDNARYGSGNKVLHNVVGGRIGVFEGNGGDLRIGLSMQSLHDGETLRHPPLRLSVFIEAPRASIDTIISTHTVVSDLVANSWLHLLRIDETGEVERWTASGWQGA